MAVNPENTSRGLLQVNAVNIQNNFPIQNARVSIRYREDPGRIIEQVETNSSGQTAQVSLPAPPAALSLEPGTARPYA